MKNSIILFALVTVFASCSKDKTTPATDPTEKGTVVLEFDNRAGSDDLILNNQQYRNAAGESLTISQFNYFVSNFRFITASGQVYTVPQDSCYFIIREDDKTTAFHTLYNVPAGDYTQVKFMIGVDSTRNTMDISKRQGTLDPAEGATGMYWSWNSGYIFVKLEGSSPASTDPQKLFRYHIGLYGGGFNNGPRTINNTREVTLTIPNNGKAIVRRDRRAQIHFFADALKLLNGTTNVSIATNPDVMVSPFSEKIADNYTQMFNIDHVHNE
ncbi:MbnP family protein [Chitinophaga sp. HK235]|uniref:MbnP family protein n=1 Tax=Chitinophaga sp. HK235 TaxID=2952571 RepID=UPI001BA5CC24|nr:MbnP family protein [Chitinophaga sp. HK235]